jgi:ATP-dependent Lon protease
MTIGQINGLAVIHAGPLTYGFPARITATIGPGTAGLINIEGQSHMSGTIHNKGFYILGGLLRHLLQTSHPLSFSSSIAFEQSYGMIDGDSASGAEMVCMLSALAGIPIRQSLAMTGAIDQHGHVQAIGGVNEKIEGFYDACRYAGLTGDQGVVIPASNAGDLMLRHDVIEACEKGKFHVYSVSTITEAVELMTGTPCQQASDGSWPRGSVVAIAVKKAEEFWQKTLAAPQRLAAEQVASAGAAVAVSPQENTPRPSS